MSTAAWPDLAESVLPLLRGIVEMREGRAVKGALLVFLVYVRVFRSPADANLNLRAYWSTRFLYCGGLQIRVQSRFCRDAVHLRVGREVTWLNMVKASTREIQLPAFPEGERLIPSAIQRSLSIQLEELFWRRMGGTVLCRSGQNA